MVGFSDRFDLGLKYTFPFAGFVEMKYCLYGPDSAKGFFFAPGLRAGYTAMPVDEGDTANDRIEMMVPLFLSWYPIEALGLTVIPSFQARFFTRPGSDYISFLPGGNVNLRLGNRVALLLEGAYYYNLKRKWHEVQGGFGIVIPLPDLFN